MGAPRRVGNSLASPQMVNVELSPDPAIMVCAQKKQKHMSTQNLNMHVRSSVIHNSPKVKTTQVTTDKHNVVPPHTGTSLSHEKERNPDTRYHVDRSREHDAQ